MSDYTPKDIINQMMGIPAGYLHAPESKHRSAAEAKATASARAIVSERRTEEIRKALGDMTTRKVITETVASNFMAKRFPAESAELKEARNEAQLWRELAQRTMYAQPAPPPPTFYRSDAQVTVQKFEAAPAQPEIGNIEPGPRKFNFS